MSRRLLLLSTTLLGCLPISVERDHPIEGYASSISPIHIAAAAQIACAATGEGPTRCWGDLGAPWRTRELPFTIPGEVALAHVAVSDNWICGLDFDRRALCAGQDLTVRLAYQTLCLRSAWCMRDLSPHSSRALRRPAACSRTESSSAGATPATKSLWGLKTSASARPLSSSSARYGHGL